MPICLGDRRKMSFLMPLLHRGGRRSRAIPAIRGHRPRLRAIGSHEAACMQVGPSDAKAANDTIMDALGSNLPPEPPPYFTSLFLSCQAHLANFSAHFAFPAGCAFANGKGMTLTGPGSEVLRR